MAAADRSKFIQYLGVLLLASQRGHNAKPSFSKPAVNPFLFCGGVHRTFLTKEHRQRSMAKDSLPVEVRGLVLLSKSVLLHVHHAVVSGKQTRPWRVNVGRVDCLAPVSRVTGDPSHRTRLPFRTASLFVTGQRSITQHCLRKNSRRTHSSKRTVDHGSPGTMWDVLKSAVTGRSVLVRPGVVDTQMQGQQK